MTDNTDALADRDSHIAELQRQIAIDRTSRETGVPPDLLGTGRTAEEIERIAADALAWKAAAAPPEPSRPLTAAVPASVVTSADRIELPGQVTTRDQLSRMSPAERMRAWREGRLVNLGANPPGPRRIGLSGAPTDQT